MYARKTADHALARGDFPKAAEAYSAILEHSENDYASILGRGLAYERTGQTKAAMEDYSRALQLRPDAFWPRIYRAGLALKLGEADAAQQDIGRLMSHSFGRLTAHKQVLVLGTSGLVQRAKGRPEEALQDFQRAIEIVKRNSPLLQLPHYTDVLYCAAQTNYEMGRFQKALDNFQAYVNVKKKLGQPITPEDDYNLAVLTYLLGKFDESRAYFLKVSPQQRQKALTILDDEEFLQSIRRAALPAGSGEKKTGPEPKAGKKNP